MRLVNHIQKFEHFVNVVEAGSISKGSVKSFITEKMYRSLADESGFNRWHLLMTYKLSVTSHAGSVAASVSRKILNIACVVSRGNRFLFDNRMEISPPTGMLLMTVDVNSA